ncbi:MAG: FadR family transcriptional regulator, partial [Desulfobacterales bacterium]|nr:FadR family transcriptional regulator [Desulfobacterales bacterium]
MRKTLEPIRSDSLKQVFINKFEKLILSGHFTIGEKLPPERELAKRLGVSRPVVHEGLVNLAAKGLVTMKPRAGAFINDYRTEGSIALLSSLFEHHEGEVSERLLRGMLDMRMVLETENAGLAAVNRTEEHVRRFAALLQEERETDHDDIPGLAEV